MFDITTNETDPINSLFNIQTFKLLIFAGDNTNDIIKEKNVDFITAINGP